MLKLKIIGLVAINGRARLEAVMAFTNIFAPDVILSLIGSRMSKEERNRLARDMQDQQKANQQIQKENNAV
jgi:signal transduction histidine kinase